MISISNEFNVTQISIDSYFHKKYGFLYPLTYRFDRKINKPIGKVQKSYCGIIWEDINLKDKSQFYNGIEMFRIDCHQGEIYISVQFKLSSDRIWLRATGIDGKAIPLHFVEICKYYDNRDAAVTISADDFGNWNISHFKIALATFRKYKLWSTIGIITSQCNSSGWNFVQNMINEGYVEPGGHSHTHQFTNCYNVEEEISPCRNAILENLDLPRFLKEDWHTYLYSWIAPYGYTNEIMNKKIGKSGFLLNRLFENGFSGFPAWNEEHKYFEPFAVSNSLDAPEVRLGWGFGAGNLDILNSQFNKILLKKGIYFLVCHPQTIEWENEYPELHLRYISNKNNVWYASLGQLFVYRLASLKAESIRKEVDQ